MITNFKDWIMEIRSIISSGDSPEVVESKLQTSELNHRTELSEGLLRDVEKSLDNKRTGFLLADAASFDLAKLLDETARKP